MQKSPAESSLARRIRSKLSKADLELLTGAARPPAPEDYDPVIARLRGKARRMEAEVARNQARARERYHDLLDLPEGRKATLLKNSSPQLLMALTHRLVRQSYSARFDDVERSLELALLAVDTADLVARAEFLSAEASADLRAEALGHLANARRINSDHKGASRTLAAARRCQARGTGDRYLKATLLRFEAVLSDANGRVHEAAALLDRELALRRLLGDPEELGAALIDRGRTAIWIDSLRIAAGYLQAGVERVRDPRLMLAALLPLGEVLAREGLGILAIKVVCQTDNIILMLGETGQLLRRQLWVKALAHRALGDLNGAEEYLLSVREAFVSENLGHLAGLVSLDLACVWSAQGRVKELKRLAEQMHAVFLAEGVEERARAAFLIWLRAVHSEKLSEELAQRVANFFVRFQRNRQLRFDWQDE